MKSNKIAVLTSGGDAQGMNAALSIITRVALHMGMEVYGVERGYRGLYEGDFVRLDMHSIENIENLGGRMLKTSRFPDFQKEKILKKCVENIKKENYDCVIVIGGDGSFKGAQALISHGVKVIGIPATVDNDLRYTEKCLGFDTAVNNACEYMINVKQTMSSLDRGAVFEVMGRYCGDIALYSAASTACDIIAVPEKPIKEEEIILKAKECMEKSGHIPTIVVAEKLFDVRSLAQKLTQVTGIEFKYSIVGYIQRGGAPTVGDKTLAMQFGVRAVELAKKGVYNKAIGIKGRKIFEATFDKALSAEYNFNYELLNLFYLLNK